MLRRLILVLLSLLALLALAAAASPWWSGGALRVAGRRWGFTFERYERIGYGRFAVTGFRIGRDNWEVTAQRVESPAAWAWLLGRARGRASAGSIRGWAVNVTRDPHAPPATATRPFGWAALQRRLTGQVRAILVKLPQVEASAGDVRWPDHEIHFDRLTWAGERLDATGAFDGGAALQATVRPAATVLEVTLAMPAREAAAELHLAATHGDGRVTLLGNAATVTADFAETGWWPRTAGIAGAQWKLPAERLRLGDAYGDVTGAFAVDWKQEAFRVSLDFAAEPRAAGAPPLAVKAEGSGDPQRVRVEQLIVHVPGIVATLGAPLEIDRAGRLLSGKSNFALRADLAAQQWFAGAGQVEGTAEVGALADGRPQVTLALSGRELAWQGVTIPAGSAAGTLTWPALELHDVTLDLGADGRLAGAITLDLRAHTMADGRLAGHVSGARLARWLPASLHLDSVAGEIEVAGPWDAPRHSGQLQVSGLRWAEMKPAELSGNWTGEGRSVTDAHVEAVRGSLGLVAEGAWRGSELAVRTARLARGGSELWRLESPAVLAWQPAWRLANATLVGPGGRIAARLDATGGEVHAALAAVPLDWLPDITDATVPAALQVRGVKLDGQWVAGRGAQFTLNAAADYALGKDKVIAVALAAHTDGADVVVDRLDFSDGTRSFAHASGRLPVAVQPGRQPVIRVDADRPVALEAVTEPYAEFWDRLATLTGARVLNPTGRLVLGGTLAKPRGTLAATADSANFDEAKTGVAWPAVESLAVRASADGAGLQLDEFSFKVDGQAARVTGRLPVGTGTWRQLGRDPAALDWRRADLHLLIDHAQLAPFARYLPRFLAPQGSLTADIALQPDGGLGGKLEISGAATRPLGSLGAVQEVSAGIAFAGRRADFRRLTASIGGEPLTVAGWVELPAGAPPRVNVSLHGTNIPVARQPGLVVRSDLDLRAVTPAQGPTRLSGTLRLRDSLYVADLRSLVPGEKRGPGRPPPYFSVEPAPLNAWQLDVKLEGNRFLRVRTPLFRGLASAQFRLSGTLGEPVATGEARLDEGTVLFPFAGFAVDRGRAFITAERPREPQLDVTGTSLRSGYDLRMELTGTADRPNLVFTARPNLTSEQILLLVMAGEPPSTSTTTALENSNQRYAQLGAYLGRNLFTTFGGDPSASDRLTITTGERLSRQGQETLEAEYELGRRWSLVGEYDEYDDYNVGLKYKVLRQQPHATEPKK